MTNLASPTDAFLSLNSNELITPISLYSSGWDQAIRRLPKLSASPEKLLDGKLDCVSVSFKPTRLKTHGFVFALPGTNVMAASSKRTRPDQSEELLSLPVNQVTRTRFKPPRDVIKLQDRLLYVLQPPLETILHGESFSFPFEPFGYQYEGIAFLYPRYTAILADEMGLGKTMQAITTIRMLLRAGEVRSVLLVCPKPLVTNWQREFLLWAPEVPLDVISGQQHRRRWQWLETQVPVKVTNYELLVRDRELLDNPSLHFDLVVLDEAQRIKNRLSTTSQVVRGIGRSRSWALTGTPIENSIEDLVGIFEYLSPGSLSAGMKPRKMAKKVGDYIMRRTKDKVLNDLPPKLFRDANVDLTNVPPTTWLSNKA